MNVTLTSLEALVLKATHECLPCPDAAALEAFCAVMRDSGDGPQLAAQALAARIHTPNAREALLALTMLDRCMRRCDTNFHAEIGKFRFLNEMIKLVSPKYFADRTAPEVRMMVLQLLHAWSIEYPKESKFKVAFEMLRNQGVVKETPPPLPPENDVPPQNKPKNVIFEDEEKSKLLQKLLQSKKPEDLQHANRLIKTMVKEEERRSEANSRRAQEVGAALDNAGLLGDMLDNAADASADEEQLIHELHSSCARLRLVLQQLAASDAQSENLNDILQTIDTLDNVFVRYNDFATKRNEAEKPHVIESQVSNTDSLLDFAGAPAEDGIRKNAERNKNNIIDDLGDLFSTSTESENIAKPLKPVNLMPSDDINLLDKKITKTEGWTELDSLGERLLKQSLPDNAKREESFNSKSMKKIPMNALENNTPKHDQQTLNNGALFDLDFFTKKPDEEQKINLPKQVSPVLSNDDVMVDISVDSPSNVTTNIYNNIDSPLEGIVDLGMPLDDSSKSIDNTSEEKEKNCVKEKIKKDNVQSRQTNEVVVKPLTDINVTLQSVQPSKVPPITVFEVEGGVTVVMHFCKDKPRPDVNVIVISTTSQHSSPIEDYKFQCVVPKGCKARLLDASGSSLPARRPFVPAPALTQLLLLARPPAPRTPALPFLITYTCDGEMYSEMGQVTNLPLDDV